MERLTVKSILGGMTIQVPRQEAINRLAAYEDTGLEPKQAMLIANVLREVGETYNCWFDYVVNCVLKNSHLKDFTQAEKDGRLTVMPSNDPLTLEELREMDFGEWIWVQNLHTERPDILSGYYRKMDGYRPEDAFYFGYPEYEKVGHTAWGRYADYGTGWLAYRRKPEEALTSE